jgi:hypothetical protein
VEILNEPQNFSVTTKLERFINYIKHDVKFRCFFPFKIFRDKPSGSTPLLHDTVVATPTTPDYGDVGEPKNEDDAIVLG